MKGIIVRWVDDRGFGFINSEELDGDIFVHVSKFKKGYRRPQIGDQVEFQLVNNAPKLSASTAQLLGVEPNKVNPFSMLLSAVFIGIVGAGFYLFGIEPEAMLIPCSSRALSPCNVWLLPCRSDIKLQE